MKKEFLLILVMLSMLAFSAYSSNQTESAVVEDKPSMFVKVEDGPMWNVYYHKDTKVMYAVSTGHYNSATFTMLVDENGDPMLWEE